MSLYLATVNCRTMRESSFLSEGKRNRIHLWISLLMHPDGLLSLLYVEEAVYPGFLLCNSKGEVR